MGNRHPTLPITVTPRTERVYIHDTCGEGTCVSEGDFVNLTHPQSWTFTTWCVHCSKTPFLGSVRWEETGETIADYKDRLRTLYPWWINWLPLFAAAAFAAVGFIWGSAKGSPIGYTAAGAAIGFFGGLMFQRIFSGMYVQVPWTHID